jgi:small subunit ribosomal protein S1
VAVASFIEETGTRRVVAGGVENRGGFRAREGQELDAAEAVEAVRQMLREEGWCRLCDGDRFYVHVGYDYYLYVGTSGPCDNSVRLTEARGLFGDRDFRSPHLEYDD